jgi:hypothetical protein
MKPISFILKKVISALTLDTLRKDVEILKILQEFLQDSSNTYTASTYDGSGLGPGPGPVPLTLTPESANKLESMLAQYPSVINSAKAHMTQFNFLYLLGQFLVILDLVVQTLNLRGDDEKLCIIWGGRSHMGAGSLISHFKGHSERSVIARLLGDLTKTQEILEDLIELNKE